MSIRDKLLWIKNNNGESIFTDSKKERGNRKGISL